MNTINNINWGYVRDLLTSSNIDALAWQYVALAVFTLFTIYSIILITRSRVVVLSHTRIWVETFLISFITLGFYRIVFLVKPSGTKLAMILFLLGVLLFSFVTRGVLQFLVFVIDRGRSLKDLERDDSVPFNCNWSLIPRCANHCLMLFILSVITTTQRQ